MKKNIIIFLIILLFTNLFAQNIELTKKTHGIQYIRYPAGLGTFPTGLYVDEINYKATCFDPLQEEFYTIDLFGKEDDITRTKGKIPYYPSIFKVGDYYWGVSSTGMTYILDENDYHYIEDVQSGICFILKKDNEYIVFFIDKEGCPGAIDTTGKIYNNIEAMEYLKVYDSEKYDQSLSYSKELELYNDFIRSRILIWGKTYYQKHNVVQQYDIQGNRYFFEDYGSLTSVLGCYFNDECVFYLKDLNAYSEIKKNLEEKYNSCWYVGFGGNIYYYISGEKYTELFRIRRTWGNPDFYAMAINGYTDDEYGKYVNEVLPKMGKADLRLLRNTIFALYGVHFKSADLSKHFDKQVWYTDEGKTSADVTLPEHRQKLVEMIQKLEK